MTPERLQELTSRPYSITLGEANELFTYIAELQVEAAGHLRLMAEMSQDIASQLVAYDLSSKFIAKYREKMT